MRATVPDVSFVFTNPRHHLDMMAPVARELRAAGVECQLISLAELRGFRTPEVPDLAMRVVLPVHLRRSPSVGGGAQGATQGRGRGLRQLARQAVSALLIPRLRYLLGRSRVIVVPNDTAYPYDRLLEAVRGKTPVILMQEGIRFAMPNGDAYGLGGASRICAWGQGSREYFAGRGSRADTIAITGSPRHDTLDPAGWAEQGRDLMTRLGLNRAPLTFMSNPIEHQGYGTADAKLAVFEDFVRGAEPILREHDLELVVKNHAFEDPATYARIAACTPAASRVRVDAGSPLFAALAVSAGAVVLTSTAGIEAILFGVPIAAMELPDGSFGFEYVQRNAAVGVRRDAIAAGLEELLATADQRRAAASALVTRHLHDRGRATANVVDVIRTALAAS